MPDVALMTGCSRFAAAATSADERSRFAVYIEPEIRVLRRVARMLTTSWVEAEDLLQDTLIRAYRGLDSFDGSHPRAWLLTIMRNTNISSRRRNRPDLLGADDNLDLHPSAFGTIGCPSPEEALIDREFGDALSRAIADLDRRFSTVLLLVDVDEFSYSEVAHLLGIPIGTVTSRLSRARQRLRHHLIAAEDSERSRQQVHATV